MTGFPGLFITGTDTGVGKTYLTAAIGRLLRQQGRPVAVSKPVATGAEWKDGRWRADDSVRLAEAVGQPDALDVVTPWVFREPASPPVAAACEGQTLRLDAIVEGVISRRRPEQFLLVEGVGGLLCPLTARETVADLIVALQLPVVVIARRSLGTLNHSLLTLEVARQRGIMVAGVVMSETTPPTSVAEQTNPDELRRRIDVPLLAVVPYEPDPVAVPAAVAAVDWWALCQSRPPLRAPSPQESSTCRQ